MNVHYQISADVELEDESDPTEFLAYVVEMLKKWKREKTSVKKFTLHTQVTCIHG